MGVGDFAVSQPLPKTNGSNVTPFRSIGTGIGGAVQPTGTQMGGFAPNGSYTQGPAIPGQQPNSPGYSNVGAAAGQQAQAKPFDTAPGWTPNYDQSLDSQLEGWRTIGNVDAQSPRSQAYQYGQGVESGLMAQLGLLGLNYQSDVNYATQDNSLNQQMLNLRRGLIGNENNSLGIDRNSIQNRAGGLAQDSEFLRTQRGIYDKQLANDLAGIQTRQDLDLLDHENKYVAGGGWFSPAQSYRKDRINQAADQSRTGARLGTEMSQLGVDRSLANNDTQAREYNFDLQKLDNRLAANGINLQMLGVNQQQLGLALQKRLDDLGIGHLLDSQKVLEQASTGGSEQADFALQMILEWLQGGGVGPIPGSLNGGIR